MCCCFCNSARIAPRMKRYERSCSSALSPFFCSSPVFVRRRRPGAVDAVAAGMNCAGTERGDLSSGFCSAATAASLRRGRRHRVDAKRDLERDRLRNLADVLAALLELQLAFELIVT